MPVEKAFPSPLAGEGTGVRGSSSGLRSGANARPVVQAAFLAELVLPPPAAGANVLAGLYGSCARLAPYRGKALRVQRVDGDGVLFDVGFEGFERPVGNWIELDELEPLVPRRERHIRAPAGLPAPEPRHPAGRTFKPALQRHDLAHMTAGFARLDGVAEAEHAIACDKGLHLARFRCEDAILMP